MKISLSQQRNEREELRLEEEKERIKMDEDEQKWYCIDSIFDFL